MNILCCSHSCVEWLAALYARERPIPGLKPLSILEDHCLIAFIGGFSVSSYLFLFHYVYFVMSRGFFFMCFFYVFVGLGIQSEAEDRIRHKYLLT